MIEEPQTGRDPWMNPKSHEGELFSRVGALEREKD